MMFLLCLSLLMNFILIHHTWHLLIKELFLSPLSPLSWLNHICVRSLVLVVSGKSECLHLSMPIFYLYYIRDLHCFSFFSIVFVASAVIDASFLFINLFCLLAILPLVPSSLHSLPYCIFCLSTFAASLILFLHCICCISISLIASLHSLPLWFYFVTVFVLSLLPLVPFIYFHCLNCLDYLCPSATSFP